MPILQHLSSWRGFWHLIQRTDQLLKRHALAHPYFKGLAKVEREPSCQLITKMEFEFERRRVTKEDIRELIFREILEYHPQLLKDYINGADRTSFLYPSAVDQFRKQFAHLEESGGKSSPVIPLERKHVSLPRSTVVHSTTVPPNKERPNPRSTMDKLSANIMRVSQAFPQRFPVAAKPGKVVGPVMPHENGGLKDSYDPRRIIRNNTLLPPQHSSIPPEYCFQRGSAVGKTNGSFERGEKTVDIAEKGMDYVVHLPPHPSRNPPDYRLQENSLMKADGSLERDEQILEVAEKRMDCAMHHRKHGMPPPPGKVTSSDIGIDTRSAPFSNQFSASSGSSVEVASKKLDERITMEANLFHVQKPHFNSGIAAAAGSVGGGAHHRKVGTVQFGMTRMY
ncbi:mitogen-activated protein kinase 15-like [Iris pallida]|uniref:Mitogen-activated protein kinase 15-like n=1 Tax=Iris pallida TaxID=29817 RepID=A0AAX6F5C5_IRIPA|nr:mitogen-activated protein kinase 15-like [Iris pallida]